MVHALKMGWMKPTKKQTEEEEEKNFYMLWKDDEEVSLSLSFSFISDYLTCTWRENIVIEDFVNMNSFSFMDTYIIFVETKRNYPPHAHYPPEILI